MQNSWGFQNYNQPTGQYTNSSSLDPQGLHERQRPQSAALSALTWFDQDRMSVFADLIPLLVRDIHEPLTSIVCFEDRNLLAQFSSTSRRESFFARDQSWIGMGKGKGKGPVRLTFDPPDLTTAASSGCSHEAYPRDSRRTRLGSQMIGEHWRTICTD